MEEDNKSFEELLNDSMKETSRMEKEVKGKVISISSNGEIFVDINYKADGIIPRTEYSFNVEDKPEDEFKPGDEITCQVLKWNDGEGNVLLSYKRMRKKIERIRQEEKENDFWNNADIGKEYIGQVSSLSSYGAFVDVGGVQGLLHISEITWERGAKASDFLKEGQEIKVKIKAIDKENKRIQFSYEGKGENPWKNINYNIGDIVTVTIKKIVPFGAFAEIEKGIEGLIHISQISEEKISKPEEKLEIGEKVNAKIIDIDKENEKIELSIRELIGTSNEYSSKKELK